MTEIIAEAGVSHGGSLDNARRLADAAIEAGARVVKYQTFDPDKLLRKNDPARAELAPLALGQKEFRKLSRHCEDLGIEFMSTPGDTDSLRFLVEECGVQRIKIGSDDLTYKPLVDAAYETGLPVILSTGMATLAEVRSALPTKPVSGLTFLHCVSLYPCNPEDINLRAMDTLHKCFGWPVGYSDHTDHLAACFAAVARGAVIVEKHFCLDGYTGPDDCVSITPKELKELILGVLAIETMLGNGVKAPTPAEMAVIPFLRKGADGRRGKGGMH